MEKARELFQNKKVLIMGLGTKGGGVASAKFAYKHGAFVTITDLQEAEYLHLSLKELSGIPEKLVLGEHRLVDFETHDIIIKNPGIKYSNKYLQHAIAHNKAIETPISLFLKFYNRPFIGITGTKGKSYTTALTSHLLSAMGIENIAAGNNCVSPLDYIEENLEFVLELSSWQLHEIGMQNASPSIACWLNFFPDHMNYYSSVNEYLNDKSQILKYQSLDDFCVVPYGYTKITELIRCNNRIFYSCSDLSENSLSDNQSVCYISKNSLFFKNRQECVEIVKIEDIVESFAQHQLELVLSSVCITIAYNEKRGCALTSNVVHKIRDRLITFTDLEHRFETIYNDKNLRIINDSAASTPESTIKAIESVNDKIILITGGGGFKNVNYSELAQKIAKQNIQTVLFANDKPSEILIKNFNQHRYTNYSIVKDLEDSVNSAFNCANNSNSKFTILFSPACSGSPKYTDMFERGNLFKQLVGLFLKKPYVRF